MEHYKKYRLKDFIKFKTGKLNSNAAVSNGKYPFFTCSQEIFRTNTYSFDTEAVLLGGNNANGIFPLKYFIGKFDTYQRTYVIESLDKKKLNNRYLYYALGLVLEHLRTISTGATTKFITKGIIENIEIPIVEIDKQQKIATILSNYDNLIENNTKRIELLEKTVKLIYDEWFVRFKFPGHEKVKFVDSELGKIPEGWEVKGITDVEYFNFISENIKQFEGEKEYFATANIDGIDIIKEGIMYSYKDKPSRAQKQPTIYSVWFARMKDTYKVLGFTKINEDIANNSMLSSGFAGFSSEKLVFPFLYYTINSKYFHKEKDRFATGATQVSLNNENLSKIKVIVPNNNIIKLFGEKVISILNKIFLLQIKNQNLKKTRDFLLPKLVSGEVDVSDLNIKVPKMQEVVV